MKIRKKSQVAKRYYRSRNRFKTAQEALQDLCAKKGLRPKGLKEAHTEKSYVFIEK